MTPLLEARRWTRMGGHDPVELDRSGRGCEGWQREDPRRLGWIRDRVRGGDQGGGEPQRQHLAFLVGDRCEPLGGGGHVQGLVGAAGGVVAGHPLIQGGLHVLDAVEGPVVGEQIPAQGLMEPLHLAGGGGRGGLGETVHDAVVPADPIEQHLAAPPEPGGELLAVVG